MFSPSSPVTGAAQTGLTSPTYTLTADVAPSIDGKQFAITALGGTQVGVTAHSIAVPFTATFTRVKNVRTVPRPNPTTGAIGNSPVNVSTFIARKGMIPLSGQAAQVGYVKVQIGIPAGADSTDPNSVAALLSLAIGLLSQQSAGIGDSVKTNII